MQYPRSIEEVIERLDLIIADAKNTNSPLGYFAALYRKVTIKVKEGIEDNFFDHGPRMEQLDVIFANRYFDAYHRYKNEETATLSWVSAFALETRYRPIVLQHLLLGMNAHINLDLGIAAAEVAKGHDITDLHNDFNKINEILASLVDEVYNDLSEIWPTLRVILKLLGKVDNYLVDFSMKLARDGAWKFATTLAAHPSAEWPSLITDSDRKVANKSRIITHPGIIINIILFIIRLGERGTVAQKTQKLLY